MKILSKILSIDSKLDIISKKTIENGYLELKCTFARTGIQERAGVEISSDLDPYKIYKEYRSKEEVCKDSVLEAFRKVVITNNHSDETLNETNTKEHAVGFISSEITIIKTMIDGKEEYVLACTIVIYDKEAIQDITTGKIELSASYLYDIEFTQNNPHYDYIQKNIIPNHIAIVQAGRCGSACSIAFDNKFNSQERKEMKVTFYRHLPDGKKEVFFEIEISNEEEAKKLQVFADSLYEKSKTMVEASAAKDVEVENLKKDSDQKDEEITAKDSEISTLQAKVDNPPKVASDCAVVTKLANDRATVVIAASAALGKDPKDLIAKDSATLRKEVIAKYNPNLALDGKDDTYLNVAFDSVIANLTDADKSYALSLSAFDNVANNDENKKKANDAKTKHENKYFGEKK